MPDPPAGRDRLGRFQKSASFAASYPLSLGRGVRLGLSVLDNGFGVGGNPSIWEQLVAGKVDPHEAYMKAIDKHRFKPFLPADEADLANAAGPYEDQPHHGEKPKRGKA